VAMSGWPLRGEDLLPWWKRAQEVCQLGPFDYDLGSWERRLRAARLPVSDAEVESKIYQLSPPTRFGPVYREELAAARDVTVVTGATAMGLEMAADGGAVERVRAGGLGGARLTVEARGVVLATGGVENARLLLLSGLGERRELVGRCFMEHPHFPAGRVVLERPLSTTLYRPRRGVIAVARLFVARAVQEREGLLHSNIMLEPESPAWLPPLAAAALRRLSPRPPRTFRMHHTLEQAPDPESRVELSEERDGLGLPRARLVWRTSERERRTFERGQALLGEALARAGIGRVEPAALGEGWPILQGRLGHHMGTTRMHSDPRRGVVDPDARVHGVRNLFVAGSSVFPTGGAGTPTYTIVALALRLADHLAGRAREGSW
jgi:choline dehydrogenase-like flavoprotein